MLMPGASEPQRKMQMARSACDENIERSIALIGLTSQTDSPTPPQVRVLPKRKTRRRGGQKEEHGVPNAKQRKSPTQRSARLSANKGVQRAKHVAERKRKQKLFGWRRSANDVPSERHDTQQRNKTDSTPKQKKPNAARDVGKKNDPHAPRRTAGDHIWTMSNAGPRTKIPPPAKHAARSADYAAPPLDQTSATKTARRAHTHSVTGANTRLR